MVGYPVEGRLSRVSARLSGVISNSSMDPERVGDYEGECNPGIVVFEVTETEVLIEPETLEASTDWFE